MSPTKATRCRARPGAWSDCSPTKLTRKISLELLRWIENGVARGVEGGMSADELLDAYQRGVLAAGKEDVEEDDETVDVEAPKDFDHEKAASKEPSRRVGPNTPAPPRPPARAWSSATSRPVTDTCTSSMPRWRRSICSRLPPRRRRGLPVTALSSTPAFQVLLLTSPPPPAGLALNAPPPVLTPISTYFATPSPPPLPPFGGSSRPPPLNGPRRGSCKARGSGHMRPLRLHLQGRRRGLLLRHHLRAAAERRLLRGLRRHVYKLSPRARRRPRLRINLRNIYTHAISPCLLSPTSPSG